MNQPNNEEINKLKNIIEDRKSPKTLNEIPIEELQLEYNDGTPLEYEHYQDRIAREYKKDVQALVMLDLLNNIDMIEREEEGEIRNMLIYQIAEYKLVFNITN